MRVWLWVQLCTLLSLCLFPPTAAGWRSGPWRLKLRLDLASGYDDNARRLATPPYPESMPIWTRIKDQKENDTVLPPVSIHGDGVHQISLLLGLQYRHRRHILLSQYNAGFKHYFLTTDEDAFSQSGQLTYYFRLHRRVLLGAFASAADLRRINTSREFSDLRGHLFMLWFAPAQFQIRLQAGYGLYQYRHFEDERFKAFHTEGFSDGRRYSSHGDAYTFQIRKRFVRAFRAFASYQFSRQFYQVLRTRSQGVCNVSKEALREDSHHQATLGFRVLYFVLFDASYQFDAHFAASCGESYVGHRLQFRFAASPFWKLFFIAQIQLQFRTFVDGTPFDPNLASADDDNLSAFTFRISRPILPHLSINLRFSHYANLFGLGINQYGRNLFTVGLSLRF